MKRQNKRTKIRIKQKKRFMTSITCLSILILLTFTLMKNPRIAKSYSDDSAATNSKVTVQSEKNLISEKPEASSKAEKTSKDKVSTEKFLAEKKVTPEPETVKKATSQNPPSKSRTNKNVLNESMFLGDSITESISFYDFLDESRVVGIKGLSIYNAKNYLNSIVKSEPQYLFILLGSNDLEGGMGSKDFKKHYKNLIEIIKSKSPNTNIYVQSILPVKKSVEDKQPNFSVNRVNSFNEALIELAEEEKIKYLDISTILDSSNKDLYEPDGIHFKYNFYELWTNFIKNNV